MNNSRPRCVHFIHDVMLLIAGYWRDAVLFSAVVLAQQQQQHFASYFSLFLCCHRPLTTSFIGITVNHFSKCFSFFFYLEDEGKRVFFFFSFFLSMMWCSVQRRERTNPACHWRFISSSGWLETCSHAVVARSGCVCLASPRRCTSDVRRRGSTKQLPAPQTWKNYRISNNSSQTLLNKECWNRQLPKFRTRTGQQLRHPQRSARLWPVAYRLCTRHRSLALHGRHFDERSWCATLTPSSSSSSPRWNEIKSKYKKGDEMGILFYKRGSLINDHNGWQQQ